MNGPAKNRLHDYEAGWLTFLIKTGMATEQEARDAMNRVAWEAAAAMRRWRPKTPQDCDGKDRA